MPCTVVLSLFVWNNNRSIICSLWTLGASFFSFSHVSVPSLLLSSQFFFFFRCTRCTLTNAISSRREWLRFFSFLTYDSERPMIQGYFPSRLSDYMRFSCGEKKFVCIYILTLMGYRMFDLVSESVSCISCTCSTFDDLCPFSSSDFRVLRRVIIFWSLYY